MKKDKDAASRHLIKELTRQGVESVSELADVKTESRGGGVDLKVTLTNGREFSVHLPQAVLLETWLASGSLRERIRRRLLAWFSAKAAQ